MKVTVCFGSVRILVPCGSGDLLVKDLIAEATKRFKKASGKEPGSWVAVHHLQTQSGILDPDDCVRDVADDREHIIATFEDSGPDPGVPQGGGDGASGSSSVGTGSPDIFRDPTNTEAPTNGNQHGDVSTPHIEVTSTTVGPLTGLGLQVRRSSDPNLLASLKAENGNKRWSAAAPHCAGESPERVRLEKNGYLAPQWEEDDDLQNQVPVNAPAQQAFARSGRLSMQFLGDGNGYKWMDAADKLQQQNQQQPSHQNPHHNYQHHQNQIFSSKSLPRESKRKEPLGQAYESIREKDGEMLLIINEHGSLLGLTAIPDNEHGGGLLVLYVEPGSRAERGRLRKGDRILEINGTKLIGLTENKVQEYLKKALESYELRVRVIRSDQKGGKSRRRDSKVAEMIEAEERYAGSTESKIAAVSPTRKPHTAPVGTSLQVANTRKLGRKIEIILKKGPNGLGFSVTTRDNPAGGDCPIYIKNILPRGAAIEDGRLKPGDRLLEIDGVPMTGKTQADVVSILRATAPGATVRIIVSRQQELSEEPEKKPKHDEEKEYIMNTPPKPPPPVLPSSAQKQISTANNNSHQSVQKSSSARSLFEQHQQHQQQNLNESQHFIDAGSESAASSDSLQAGVAWRSREELIFHIPVHDTEKAGLGVSVKGKTTHNTTSSSSGSNGSMKHDGDLGIFVKNVIHGGAASRDGRLRMNDQLLSVNGVSLLRQNNAEAMETLRRAMVNNPGKHPGMITLRVARKISRSASSGDIIEQANSSSNTSENSGATVIYLTPEKKDARDGNGHHHGHYEKNRFSNPLLDRLTGGVCSSNSNANGQRERRSSRDNLLNAPAAAHGLRNDSYYMATNESWSPVVHIPNGHGNNSLLIEDDPEPLSPILPKRPNESTCTQSSMNTTTPSGVVSFDATYSSQLSLETNNSGLEHFSRDALGRRSISEKHHAALDARETGTYQRNKKIREDRERERRIQLTKSAIFSGSMESLTARIAQANSQIPGYKHAKTTSGIEAQQLQAEAQDQVGDLGPSLGLKKSSSLESLQTMVQEIQMSDEPRGPTALRAPRGRGREESLRAAVTGDNTGKPRKTWLLEDADADGGFTNRNGPFQSSLNDGKSKSRAKKPSILRGIGHMFRFGKNRKDGVVPAELQPATNQNERPNNISAPVLTNTTSNIAVTKQANNQIPVAALSALERNTKLPPPAYQPPPPLGVSPNNSNNSGNGLGLGGIHQNDIFNHRYQHYANYEEIPQQQISDTDDHSLSNDNDVLSESTLECMRQQVLRQRIKVEAESRRHQHYHSQRSARSQDINLHSQAIINNINHGNLNGNSVVSAMGLRPSSYFEYETIQQNVTSIQHQHQQQNQNQNQLHLHQQQNQKAQQQHPHQQRNGSIKQNGHSSSPITVNGSLHHPQMNGSVAAIPHWKQAALNGFSPASLNGSARSRGPFITQVTIRDQTSPLQSQQPTYQTIQKPPLPPQQQQQQIQQNSNPAASKV